MDVILIQDVWVDAFIVVDFVVGEGGFAVVGKFRSPSQVRDNTAFELSEMIFICYIVNFFLCSEIIFQFNVDSILENHHPFYI